MKMGGGGGGGGGRGVDTDQPGYVKPYFLLCDRVALYPIFAQLKTLDSVETKRNFNPRFW